VTTRTSPASPWQVLKGGIKLIARFVKARPGTFAVAVIGAAMFASAIVLAALVVGHITDTLIIPVLDQGASPVGLLRPAIWLIMAVALWKSVGIIIRRVGASWLQMNTQADVRMRLIEHKLGLKLSWLQTRSTGDLLAVTDSDASQAIWILGPLPYGTGVSLLLVGTVIMIFTLDPWLGLLTLLAVAAIVAMEIRGSWAMFAQFETVQSLRGDLSSVAHESFDGALTVKALGREDFEAERFGGTVDRLRDELVRVGRKFANYRSFADALPLVSTIVLIVAGSVRVAAGDLSAGDMVTVAYLFSLSAVPVRLVGYVLWEMASSLAGWERVETVLSVGEAVEYGALRAVPEISGADVTGRELDFAYDAENPILRSLRFDIPAGKTVAVVGPTGAGKTTLTLLLARLWDPASGSVSLDGRDLRDFARSELSSEVAYVSQQAFLFDDTVTGNITLGAAIPMDEVRAAARLAGAEDFVEELSDGFDTRIGERGTSLSGGQQQRIALARALARRPRLLILDDATSAVDPSVEAAILRRLKSAELPSTVVLVAYRRASVMLADEVVFIDGGRVVGHGSHEQLMVSQPGYARLLRAYEEEAERRSA
jgi:ABC-type multidrug transport system fused ATPase/permease subunit